MPHTAPPSPRGSEPFQKLPVVRSLSHRNRDTRKGIIGSLQGALETMLETIVVVLLILWVLGLVTSNTMGGVIHVLLVIAVVVILLRVIQGRRL